MADTVEKDETVTAEDEKKEPVEKAEEKKDEEVPVRKSFANRQERAEFFKAKQAEKKNEDDSEEEAELTPKARKLIEEEIEKRVAPFRDELGFRDWFSDHPEDKKYEKQARARFEAWANVPIREVMLTLRPETSADEKSKAEEKVARGAIKGSTSRPRESQVATSEADLKKVYENVKRGRTGEALKSLGIN